MTAAELDTEYGWIVPGPGEGALHPVLAFCEKPAVETARSLMRRGALVNTLMFSVTAARLLELFRAAAPILDEAFASAATGASERSAAGLRPLYAGLSTTDFSQLVLERSTETLWVLRSRSCGWTDLGTPKRLRPYQRQVPPIATARQEVSH